MLTKLSQLRDQIDKEHKPKKLVLAASDDADSLNAVISAAEQNIIRPVFVGDKAKTLRLAESLGLDISKYEIIEAKHPADAVITSVKMVHE